MMLSKKFLFIAIAFMQMGCANCEQGAPLTDCIQGDSQKIESTKAKIISLKEMEIPKSPYVQKEVEGCVKLSFNISEYGKAENIKVLYSYPKKLLEKNAIKSLKGSTFKVDDIGTEEIIVFHL